MSHVVHEGAKSRRIDVVFDVYKETSIKDAERATEVQAQGSISRTFNLGTNIPQWRKFLVVPPTRQVSQVPGRRMEKTTAQGEARGKELYVTCEQLCFKIPQKSSGKRLLSLSQVKKKQTHAPFSMHFMQQNLGTSLSSSTAEDTTSWSCVWACATRSHPTCSRSVGRRTGQDSWISPPLSRTLGGSVCDSLIGMPCLTGCDTLSAFAGRGKMERTLKQVKMDKTYQDAFHELGRSWEVSPELFEKLQEITCHMYLPSTHTTR
ncbi:hypothetical protein GWK47_034921 [Chionoecetes opilio]|uniref:Uncharacterized protein n=1 Tax=Chionoecetes opilio TaxID=41210 RepID=A0A8J4YQV2_CHIOP|nr:hypothetical protein GWK47_034921 [Chionoecetes opilio]